MGGVLEPEAYFPPHLAASPIRAIGLPLMNTPEAPVAIDPPQPV